MAATTQTATAGALIAATTAKTATTGILIQGTNSKTATVGAFIVGNVQIVIAVDATGTLKSPFKCTATIYNLYGATRVVKEVRGRDGRIHAHRRFEPCCRV